MRRLECKLPGPILLEPNVHGDARGFFVETARTGTLADLGITEDFVQDNHSRSSHGVLRGMHFQPGMAKLIRCARGRIFDVLVDIRPESPSFGRWEAFELDDERHRQLYCPDGFAHGFCVLSDAADVIYRCSAYYDPERESGFRYDDPEVGVEWPKLTFSTSERDRHAPLLRELALTSAAPERR
ncbi:MAG TPA: dTDP-4-dehydrorhamnose 3,5-epimerase [Thermoleophilaceae bacterium]|nr:dTDP-4-dehydrorhamnose 3,5-epimerase [Thermoleophilaceae bacterium]